MLWLKIIALTFPDHTGDSAYGSDHQHCHIADDTHHEEVFMRQNQYLQSNLNTKLKKILYCLACTADDDS